MEFDNIYDKYIKAQEKRENQPGADFLRNHRALLKAALDSKLIYEPSSGTPKPKREFIRGPKILGSDPWFNTEEATSYYMDLQRMGLSRQAVSALFYRGTRYPRILNINQLLQASPKDLISVHNIGPKLLAEILEKRSGYEPEV